MASSLSEHFPILHVDPPNARKARKKNLTENSTTNVYCLLCTLAKSLSTPADVYVVIEFSCVEFLFNDDIYGNMRNISLIISTQSSGENIFLIFEMQVGY